MNVTLRLYSDFVCPFCFIAEHSTVPRLLQELDLVVEWCGFELHPQTPKGGMPLTALFPAREIPAVKDHMRRFAARFGVTGMNHPDRLPNTRRALAVAELAREQGFLDAFRAAAMDGYWLGSRDLEDDDDLSSLAAGAGLDPARALAAADDPVYLLRVDQKQADARAHGVTGIPTFFFGEEEVVGCQAYEVLREAAERAGAKPRR